MIGRVSDIDLRLLRAFVAVVEAGGFSLASARLNVSESTISSHMADLEKRLGCRLCERGRSGFRLTGQGEKVYEATLEILDELDRYRERLATVSTRIGSALRLGVADAILTNDEMPVSSWIDSVAQRFPRLRVEVNVLDPRGLERMTMTDRLHAALTPVHRPIAGLVYEPIGEELNFIYCGRQHPLFAVSDLDLEPAMLEEGGLISRGYIDDFDADFFSPDVHRATATEIEGAALLILSGHFLGFLPEHYARGHVAAGEMRALKPDDIRLSVPFALAYKRDMEGDMRIETLVSVISAKAARRRVLLGQ